MKKIGKTDLRLQQKGKCETCKKEFKNKQLWISKNKPDEIRTLKLCHDCWTESRKKLKKGGAKGKSDAKDGSDESSATTDWVQNDSFLAVSCKDSAPVPSPMMDAAVKKTGMMNSAGQSAGRHKATKMSAVPCKDPAPVPGPSTDTDYTPVPGLSMDAAVEGGWQVVARRRHGNRHRGRQRTTANMALTAEVAIPPMMWNPERGWTHKAEGHGKISLTAFTREEDL